MTLLSRSCSLKGQALTALTVIMLPTLDGEQEVLLLVNDIHVIMGCSLHCRSSTVPNVVNLSIVYSETTKSFTLNLNYKSTFTE